MLALLVLLLVLLATATAPASQPRKLTVEPCAVGPHRRRRRHRPRHADQHVQALRRRPALHQPAVRVEQQHAAARRRRAVRYRWRAPALSPPPPPPPYGGSAMDCAVRKLAWVRAAAALSGGPCGEAEWAQLRASLTSDGNCGSVLPPAAPTTPRDSGSVDGKHTVIASPANFSAALATARQALTESGSATLLLQSGLYEIQAPLTLTPADSGLTIASAAGATPVLSGGRRLTLQLTREGLEQNWGAVYSATVPIGLLEANQLLSANGTRLRRARYPNGDLEQWTEEGGNSWASPTGSIPREWPSGTLAKLESPIDPKHIPQGGDSLQAFSVLVGGEASIYAGGRNPAGETYGGGGAGGLNLSASDATRAAHWTAGPTQAELIVKGIWGSYSFAVESVSGSSLTFGKGGSQLTTACQSGDFIVENALSELDSVGEWIHDAANGKVYLGLSKRTPKTTKMEVTLAQLERVVAVVGTRDTPVRNVTLSGLSVAHTQSTRLSQPYESPSNGDWTIVRTGAVFASGVERRVHCKSVPLCTHRLVWCDDQRAC